MIPLGLSGSVGYDEDNDPNDVARTGNALATLGHFDALEAAQSGMFDGSLDGAIRRYQAENDLDADGVLLPNGPTQNALNESLRDHRPGPSLLPDEARSVARRHDNRLLHRANPHLADNASVDGTQGVTVVAARASAPTRRIESIFENLAYDLDTATAYVKRGEGNVRVTVPIRSSATAQNPADGISRINAGIREAVVANALLNRPTSPDEIASVTRDVAQNPANGPLRGRSRVKDMLTEAALNGATPDQRLHARGLLAVYEMEEREAKAAGRPDPRAKAASAIAAFAAGLNGEVPWSVYDPEEAEDDDEDEDHDGLAEPAADDPDNPRRPRGMHDERTREAAREGKRRHDELKRRVDEREDRGWHRRGYTVNGQRIFPDATTRRGYLLELKPDTPSGRAAGAKQCAEYTRVTNKRCRVIYYQPNSSTGSRGGAGTPKLTRPWGVGSNRLGNPKLPRTPWDLLE